MALTCDEAPKYFKATFPTVLEGVPCPTGQGLEEGRSLCGYPTGRELPPLSTRPSSECNTGFDVELRHPGMTVLCSELLEESIPPLPTLGRLLDQSDVEGAHEVIADARRQIEHDLGRAPCLSETTESDAKRVQLVG